MSLLVTVGQPREGAAAARFAKELAGINQALDEAKLDWHREPEAEGQGWQATLPGPEALHALGEIAGLIWKGRPIPGDRPIDGRDTPTETALFEAILPHVFAARRPQRRILFGRRRVIEPPPFAHLTVHSDSEGAYVPADFALPLVPVKMPKGTESYWPLGSAPRLAAELARIAEALGIPDGLTHEDPALADLAPRAGSLWQAQPLAVYSCRVLQAACVKSLATGAAICFDTPGGPGEKEG
ncbi:hypothetical protein [Solirhodobacter olei]|uniref:hypothetical protein n=1 Tax=Solirhodobacter olei TaxID=2493082 RepID=UPI000FDCBA81|nr:hypothetical protein [Solirhodobacter olei]